MTVFEALQKAKAIQIPASALPVEQTCASEVVQACGMVEHSIGPVADEAGVFKIAVAGKADHVSLFEARQVTEGTTVEHRQLRASRTCA